MSDYKDWQVVDGHKEEAELDRRGISPKEVFGGDLTPTTNEQPTKKEISIEKMKEIIHYEMASYHEDEDSHISAVDICKVILFDLDAYAHGNEDLIKK